MPNETDFHTRDFSFEDGTLFLFRRRYIYKKMPYQQIESVTIKKGSTLRRPRLTLTIGIVLILLSVYPLISEIPWMYMFMYVDSGLFFVTALGAYALYSGLPIHPIIEIKFEGEVECHSVSVFIKNKTLDSFIAYLKKELGTSKVYTASSGI